MWGFQAIRNTSGVGGSRRRNKHELRQNRHNFKIIGLSTHRLKQPAVL